MLLTLFLLLLATMSALLSASETALTAASSPRLHRMEKQGEKRASIVLALQKDMNHIIATLLLANTIVITSLAAIATMLFTRAFGDAGVAYATIVTSIMITIYLEVMPKALAFPRAEKASIMLAPFVNNLQKTLAPLTRLVDLIAKLTLKVLGLRPPPHNTDATVEDLQGAIDMHNTTSEAPKERRMLHNILDLTRITVAEVMLHKNHVFSLDGSKSSHKLMGKIFNSPFTRIPVWRGSTDKIEGLLHVKELYRALQKVSAQDLEIDSILIQPWFIPHNTTLLRQLQAFRERREHFAFVVDEYGMFVGIITLEDILEEIVGDIKDEHDSPTTGIILQKDGSFLVEGSVTLRDLNRENSWDLPENSSTTLAGFVLETAGYIPKEGQIFEKNGLKIQIMKRQRNQLKFLRVWPIKSPEA